MTRQRLGSKKINQLRQKLGLPIAHGSARGGENHSLKLYLEDETCLRYYPRTGEIFEHQHEQSRKSENDK